MTSMLKEQHLFETLFFGNNVNVFTVINLVKSQVNLVNFFHLCLFLGDISL